MYNQIRKIIEAYDKIVIHRHKNPDLDALGSQLGLKKIIEANYPTKEVKVVGDENNFSFIGSMDQVEDTFYEGALAIVTDVAVRKLVSDERVDRAEKVMIIDHHLNDADFGDIVFNDASHIAVCQLITTMCIAENLIVTSSAATALFAGLVTDSGRFLYPSTKAQTFKIAAYLLDQGADMQMIYDHLYTESMQYKKLQGYFINNFKTTPNNVAFIKNERTVKERFAVTTSTVSRGMVNQMANIKEVPIWANFTEDDDGLIICELRSKRISIVDIAKKYGGGGHKLACGCTVENWQMTDKILNDLDQLAQKEANHECRQTKTNS